MRLKKQSHENYDHSPEKELKQRSSGCLTSVSDEQRQQRYLLV